VARSYPLEVWWYCSAAWRGRRRRDVRVVVGAESLWAFEIEILVEAPSPATSTWRDYRESTGRPSGM
jgi:hypothetical protein